MRFFINPDAGEDVTGWLSPDDYKARTRIRVVLDGQDATLLDCTVPYPVLKDWGWHETGLCGFNVGEASVPGAGAAQRLEIYDPDANVLLYRRVRGTSPLAHKLLFVTTGVTPETALKGALFDLFRIAYFNVETMTEETFGNVMGLAKWMDSILVCGNVLVPRYEDLCAHSAISSAMLIRDPWETLAAGLDRLRRSAPLLEVEGQAWRVARQREAVAFAQAFDPHDRRAARRLLRELPETVYRQLANPLTRQLGTKQAGGSVEAEHAAVAIEVLSRVDVVGHTAHYDAFLATLFDHLGTAAPAIEPDVASPEVLAAAEALRADGEAEFLIDHDLRLSETVADIIAKQWAA